MRVTRLHLLLLLIILFLVGLFIAQKKQQNEQSVRKEPIEKTELETSLPINKPVFVEPVKQLTQQVQQPPVQKQHILQTQNMEKIAKNTIAIAGEYWKLAKKENRNLKQGQATLRRAKEVFNIQNYGESIKLAKEAIEQLKSANKIDIKKGTNYLVKRRDCLWNIAKMKQHYGQGSMWVKIWRNNESKIQDFDIIIPGQVILIP